MRSTLISSLILVIRSLIALLKRHFLTFGAIDQIRCRDDQFITLQGGGLTEDQWRFLGLPDDLRCIRLFLSPRDWQIEVMATADPRNGPWQMIAKTSFQFSFECQLLENRPFSYHVSLPEEQTVIETDLSLLMGQGVSSGLECRSRELRYGMSDGRGLVIPRMVLRYSSYFMELWDPNSGESLVLSLNSYNP